MDPLSLTVQRDLAFAQFLNGRFEDAIANCAAGRRRGSRIQCLTSCWRAR